MAAAKRKPAKRSTSKATGIVQVKTKTGRYIKINRTKGRIMGNSATKFAGVPVVAKKRK